MEQDNSLRVDVDALVRSRAPRYYKYIPKFIIRWLERTVCQDRVNDFLSRHGHERDAEFCRSLLADLKINIDVNGEENLPSADNRRVLFVSNHPLGGLDGVALIDYVQRRYGGHVGFVVNDLLTVLKPLNGVFIPINKHGVQNREAVEGVDRAFAGNDPLLMFPAGLVSRRQKGGEIRDLEWMKMFVTKARQSGRTIIPLYFNGENSSFFYKFAKFRKRLGVKFNVEMIYLPKEMFMAEGKSFSITFGKPIDIQSFPKGMKAAEIAQNIKETVYSLRPQKK